MSFSPQKRVKELKVRINWWQVTRVRRNMKRISVTPNFALFVLVACKGRTFVH